jgi:putative membrane-bound dehydrogenase-like protein
MLSDFHLDLASILGIAMPTFGLLWFLVGCYLLIRRKDLRLAGLLMIAGGIISGGIFAYLAFAAGKRAVISLDLIKMASTFFGDVIAVASAGVIVFIIYRIGRRLAGNSSVLFGVISIIGIALYTIPVLYWLAANTSSDTIEVFDDPVTVSIFDDKTVRAPTALALGPNNELYVAGFGGKIWVLQDKDGDGKADFSSEFAKGLVQPEGLLWYKDGLYVNVVGSLTFMQDTDGDYVADKTTVMFDKFPDITEIHPNHMNNGIALGPDGRLYVGSGSTTDRFAEPHPYAAGIFSMNPDGTDVKTYATGLRNPFAFVNAPGGGFFSVDNGSSGCVTGADGKEDCVNKIYVPEEVNFVTEGGDYGFPDSFGVPAADSTSIPPMVTFGEHMATTGIVIYNGDKLPAKYKGQLFVSFWSANQIYNVRYVKIDDRHYTGDTHLFLRGILGPGAMINSPDGGIFVASYLENSIYHIG